VFKRLGAVVLAILFINSPDHALFGQTDEDISSHCQAAMGSIGSDTPHAYEKYFEHAALPELAAKSASEKLANTVDVIAVAPVTEDDYRTIFFSGEDKGKQPVTQAQKDEIESVRKTLKDKFGKTDGARDFGKKNFRRLCKPIRPRTSSLSHTMRNSAL
jgi:hypothetical protein